MRYVDAASAVSTGPTVIALDVGGTGIKSALVGPDGTVRHTRRRPTGQALFDAEVIVLGGGLAEAGEALLDPVRRALRQRLTFHREPRLVRAALGDRAGCLGAALLALDTLAPDRIEV